MASAAPIARIQEVRAGLLGRAELPDERGRVGVQRRSNVVTTGPANIAASAAHGDRRPGSG